MVDIDDCAISPFSASVIVATSPVCKIIINVNIINFPLLLWVSRTGQVLNLLTKEWDSKIEKKGVFVISSELQ